MAAMHFVLVGVLAAMGPQGTPRMYLGTGGGLPGEPQFQVVLDSDGVLTVSRTALAFAKQDLETTEVSVQLAADDFASLMDLGMAVDDFGAGCLGDEGADFTSAVLYVETDAGVNEQKAEHCPEWPLGPRARLLVDSLNALLPESHRVF